MVPSLKKIVIICGPTGAGKSAVAVSLAQKLGGEIVSADSQAVYRGMDIGTAKPSKLEREAVPHHLIDVADPDEHFDAFRFVKLADEAINDIISRGKVPFVVGGTGMYIRMLVHGVSKAPGGDEELRRGLEIKIKDDGLRSLHDRLREIDPEAAAKIKATDKTRIIRALEVFELTGSTISSFNKEHQFAGRRYDALQIGINAPREELYKKINARIDAMLVAGLLDEVKGLVKKYGSDIQSLKAVGYKEFVEHLRGDSTLARATELAKQHSRQYAKRQLTWFKNVNDIKWFESGQTREMMSAICQFIGLLDAV